MDNIWDKIFRYWCIYITGYTGEYFYPLHDHLGSVRVVVDKDANVVEAFDYYPFGAELCSTVNDNQAANLRFTGKELDKESHIGLYYFGARYYDPSIGRFISVDPHSDSYPALTPYHYAGNNPLMYIDPTGMDSVQAQQLNQQLQQTHTENMNRTLVCNTTVIGAVGGYLSQQNASAPTELVDSQGNALTANQMIQNMENSDNFQAVSAGNAMELADNGAVVIVGEQGTDHGHVDVIGAGGTIATGNQSLQGQNPRSIGNSTTALQGSWEERGRVSWSFTSPPTYYHYTGFTPRPNSIVLPEISINVPRTPIITVPRIRTPRN